MLRLVLHQRHGCTQNPIIFAKKSKLVGKIHAQIRIQIAHVRGFGCSISHSRKGRGRADIPCRPAKRPTKNWQGRRHSPVVAAWKEGGRPSELAREKRKGAREREKAAAERALHVGRAQEKPTNAAGKAHKRRCASLLCFLFVK